MDELSDGKDSTFKLEILFDFPGEDLATEITRRKFKNHLFSNQEITQLMYNIIYGNAHLNKIEFV
jgi:hypothetical protein